MNKGPWSGDLRGLEVEQGCRSSVMYDGARQCRALYVIIRILNSILNFTGRQ